MAPLLNISSSGIGSVPSLRYLGSLVESHVALDLDDKSARASKAFETLRKSMPQDSPLSRQTKKLVYQAVVLNVLLYAAEAWPAKQIDIRRLEGFHHHCLMNILGISRVQQCVQHISNEEVQKQFDMKMPLAAMIACRRLWWLGL